jgi:hypothetical protein
LKKAVDAYQGVCYVQQIMNVKKAMRPLSSCTLDRFLYALANAPKGPGLLARFQRHRLFARMLPQEPRANGMVFRLAMWRAFLRRAWGMANTQQREAFLDVPCIAVYGSMRFAGSDASQFAAALLRVAKRQSLQTGLRPDAFLQALYRARAVARRMRKCAWPGCQHPFFLAVRVTQKFCSKACAAPAKQESKNRWWRDKGIEWRRKQKAKRRPKKAQRKGGKRR